MVVLGITEVVAMLLVVFGGTGVVVMSMVVLDVVVTMLVVNLDFTGVEAM